MIVLSNGSSNANPHLIMFEQQIAKDVFMVLYGGAAVLGLVACCYLLFRRGNAFAPEITSPLRLRRWTAALFAAMTLSHAWYFPMYVQNASDHTDMYYIIGGLLDFLTVIPLAIIVLLAMLQDYKRPLWPVALAVAPLVLAGILSAHSRSLELLPYIYGYFLLMCIGILIYMVRATRRYGRWLRDNYADLEHKEVWQSLVVLGTTLLSRRCPASAPAHGTSARLVPEHRTIAHAILRTAAPLPARRHLPLRTRQADRRQPRLSKQALCQPRHHLQCLHQRASHPALHQSLPKGSPEPSAYNGSATGIQKRIPHLRNIQFRLQAKHGNDGHRMDAGQGRTI